MIRKVMLPLGDLQQRCSHLRLGGALDVLHVAVYDVQAVSLNEIEQLSNPRLVGGYLSVDVSDVFPH